jgi:hypothetical protein
MNDSSRDEIKWKFVYYKAEIPKTIKDAGRSSFTLDVKRKSVYSSKHDSIICLQAYQKDLQWWEGAPFSSHYAAG